MNTGNPVFIIGNGFAVYLQILQEHLETLLLIRGVYRSFMRPVRLLKCNRKLLLGQNSVYVFCVNKYKAFELMSHLKVKIVKNQLCAVPI